MNTVTITYQQQVLGHSQHHRWHRKQRSGRTGRARVVMALGRIVGLPLNPDPKAFRLAPVPR